MVSTHPKCLQDNKARRLATVSPSILDFHDSVAENEEAIRRITRNFGAVHVDMMSPDFIPYRDETFQGDSIKRIYGVVDRSAIIDFHLMYMNPEKAIEKIDGIVNPSGRSNVNITVHREAYCDDICDKNAFAAELNGALLGKNGSRKELEKATKRLSKTIAYLKDAGYSVGMAFEPETGIFTLDDTLIGLSDETIGKLDLLLPMTVVSGKGGQVYMDDLGWKIEAASDKYDGRAMSGKKIQVDGGIKDRNIYHPLSMGARDLVIGSYVTRPFLNGEENPGANMLRISNLINQFNGTTTYS